jgi:uncharacterized membrane protein
LQAAKLARVAFVLTLLGALLACSVELLEALAIVLAVGVTRGYREALYGAAGAAVAVGVVAAVAGPLLLARVPLDALRIVIGTLLLLFGLEWLRKGVLRLAGLRSRSSSFREFVEQRDALEEADRPPAGEPDWAARTVAFKGVLLEGVEVVLIVTALAERPGGVAPALIGAALATVLVVAAGIALRAPLSQVPETHVKYVVGVALTTFGVFFASEGLGVSWPLGDAALLYVAALIAAVSRLQIGVLARERAAVAVGSSG